MSPSTLRPIGLAILVVSSALFVAALAMPVPRSGVDVRAMGVGGDLAGRSRFGTLEPAGGALVAELGSIPGTSRAVDGSVRSLAPADDILGSPRDARPDLGAFEAD